MYGDLRLDRLAIKFLRREENCSAGGGGVTRRPIFPTPRPPSLAAVMGGGVHGGGARPASPGGGGVNPTSMAQNDTHVALIILTTQMWQADYWWKKNFGPKSPRRGCWIKAGQACVGKNATYPPHFGPFWAYSRTLPQGVELLV